MANPTLSIAGGTIILDTGMDAAAWRAEYQQLVAGGMTPKAAKELLLRKAAAEISRLMQKGSLAIGRTDAEIDAEADAARDRVLEEKAARPDLTT